MITALLAHCEQDRPTQRIETQTQAGTAAGTPTVLERTGTPGPDTAGGCDPGDSAPVGRDGLTTMSEAARSHDPLPGTRRQGSGTSGGRVWEASGAAGSQKGAERERRVVQRRDRKGTERNLVEIWVHI